MLDRYDAHDCKSNDTSSTQAMNNWHDVPGSKRAACPRKLPEATAKRPRAKSLWDLVRGDVIQAKKDLGHRVNITSCEFIDEVRTEHMAVKRTPHRLATYASRLMLEDQPNEVMDEARPETALVALPRPGPASVAVAQSACGPPVDMTGSIDIECTGQIVKHPVLRDRPQYPVSTNLLAHMLGDAHGVGERAGPSYEKIEKEFACKHNQYATPSPSNGAKLPRRPRWRATPFNAYKHRERVETLLRDFIPRAISPHKVAHMPWAKLLIKCETEHKTMWLAGASGNACAGQVPFVSHFIECEETARSVVGGSVFLALKRQPYLATTTSLPFGGLVDMGMMQHHTHWDCAALLLEGEMLPRRITLMKMKHTLLGGDQFKVLGVDPTVDPAVLSFDEDEARPHRAAHEGVDWDSGLLPAAHRHASAGNPRPQPSASDEHQLLLHDWRAPISEFLDACVPPAMMDLLCEDGEGDVSDDAGEVFLFGALCHHCRFRHVSSHIHKILGGQTFPHTHP